MTSTASEDRRRNIFYTGTATASVQYLPERPTITSDQRHARSTLTFNGRRTTAAPHGLACNCATEDALAAD
ncbi:hypothetical protein RP20_CCG019158 [Aedes albopictus]|nr:hypothetical protein RP20_CCG019158 [Aedes albopictus]